jgi:subtilisin family serine protease
MTPQVKTNCFITGLSSVDMIFSNYSVESVHQQFSSIKKKDSKIGLKRIFKIRFKKDVNIDLIIQELLKCSEVEYAEKNKIYQALSDDVYFPLQYALENLEYPEADIRAVEAWQVETGNSSVIVSVVDTGIDYYHADLKNQVIVDLGYDYVNEDSDPLDDCGHGSHVAGIIGATYNNLYSIAGVAPNISIVPFKVLDENGEGTSDDLASAIVDSVDIGAKVINLSLGLSGDDSDVEDALRYADENGCLAVAAAGNDGISDLSYPASSQYTISVGATDNENLRADFSNYGEGLDIMAPGEDILSIYTGGLTCYASGTSMATPHVSGVAALIASNFKSPSLDDIKNRLFETALDLGDPGYDIDFGWGLVDAFNSLSIPLDPGEETILILTATSPNVTIMAGTDARVYGTASSNQITLESGAKAELINFPGQNTIQIQSRSDLFTVSRSGTVVTFEGSDETILKIPATTDPQTIAFTAEESRVLQIHNDQVMLDDQVITTTAATINTTF